MVEFSLRIDCLQIGKLKFVRQSKFDQGDISLRFPTDRLVGSILYDDVSYIKESKSADGTITDCATVSACSLHRWPIVGFLSFSARNRQSADGHALSATAAFPFQSRTSAYMPISLITATGSRSGHCPLGQGGPLLTDRYPSARYLAAVACYCSQPQVLFL